MDQEAWQTAMVIASVLTDPECLHIDVTEGATFYHATNVSPRWRYTMKMTVQIGGHIFYTPDNIISLAHVKKVTEFRKEMENTK